MILLTGAAGKTGRAVIRALTAKGQAVRAFVHREEHISSVTQSSASEAAVGDMRDAEAVRRAMQGVRAVYHICPNVNPEEVVIGNCVIGAARAAGVERFVYHSVLHPQTEAMPHHWNKLRVEEALFESGLPFTALQPAPYMQ
ncbi:MAG: NmrA family NAD(P)-binding protein, partial [Chloroflexi bacterium]|nr:NmrA family NAD(P)-binding protein [Chloroflexota bacterium]